MGKWGVGEIEIMDTLKILEIIIGLIFIYLLLSTLATLVVEYISAGLGLRAENLKKVIARALDDDGNKLSDKFYEYPLIKYLGKKDGKLPSYISSAKFAKTVLDIIRTKGNKEELGKTSSLDENSISDAIDQIQGIGSNTKALLKSYAKEAGEDINDFGDRLEDWFNETVERGQGWFNRHIKKWTIVVSIGIAIIINADSVRIYQTLSDDANLRAQIANNASVYINNQNDEKEKIEINEKISKLYRDEIDPYNNSLGLGWDIWPHNYYSEFCGLLGWLTAIFGWIVTGMAISLGAPFWFGVLNKLTALRAAGKAYQDDQSNTKRKNQINKQKPVG